MGDLAKTREELRLAANDLICRERELCKLDSYVGDGDHGSTIRKGFEIIKKVSKEPADSISELFMKCSLSIMDAMGGAIGPILASVFMGFSEGAQNKDNLLVSDWHLLFLCAERNVIEVGGAKPGDRTLVDTLHAINNTFKNTSEEDACKVWEAVEKGAYEGAQSTKNMEAKMGRAKYLGKKSLGYVDAGAMTMYYFTRIIADEERNIKEH